MRPRSSRHIVAAAWTGALLLLAVSCASDEKTSFTLRYTVAASDYDNTAATRALHGCVVLPGARRGFVNQSDPPQPTVLFEGSGANLDALERCLRRLPNVVVTRQG